jgi:anti-sigma-K factor RskA
MMGLGPEGDGLQRMKDVPEAQAFAVTLERAGGSPTPTLEAMVLMGPV